MKGDVSVKDALLEANRKVQKGTATNLEAVLSLYLENALYRFDEVRRILMEDGPASPSRVVIDWTEKAAKIATNPAMTKASRYDPVAVRDTPAKKAALAAPTTLELKGLLR